MFLFRLTRGMRALAAAAGLALLAGCSTVAERSADSGSRSDSSPVEGTGLTMPGTDTGTSLNTGAHLDSIIPQGPLSDISFAPLGSLEVKGLQPPADLWGRIRQGFAIPDLETPLTRERTQWYASKPEHLERMTERSSKYLFYIVEELERRNMPTELALLPFIESSFNPQAVSHAKAAGMWQFMPATGNYFDLTQNAFRDERRDIQASTRAALDYLQKLYNMFGDWHLALAAYNWGEGSVSRARAKNKSEGKPTGYTHLSMPEETRMYVPKFQAIKNIVANPRAHGVKLAHIGNHPYFDLVDITRDKDVEVVARLAGISVDDFRALNPAHNGPVIFAAATKEVLLPWENAQIYKKNLAASKGLRLASWTVWKAPKTMNTADAAKSLGVSEDVLKEANRIPANMLIANGSTLLVPRAKNDRKNVAPDLANNGQLQLEPASASAGAAAVASASAKSGVVAKAATAKAPATKNATAKNAAGKALTANAKATGSAQRKQTVVVRKGDTMSALAKRYAVRSADIANWNKIKLNATLKPGQTLVVYQQPVAAPHKKQGNTPQANTRLRK